MTLRRCKRSSRKWPGLHPHLEILVSRGDDADVDLHRRLAADTIELAFGQHAQQARLQRRRHVADFVEKQGAAIRLLEAPPPLRIRARERAFFMAEQFRFQQVRGEGGGVERDEGLVRARAMAVQSSRHEFLARARFARDQNRHAGARQSADRSEHLLHGCRLAQKLGDAAPGGLRVGRQIGLLRGTAHKVDRLVDVEWLGQIFECAALIGRNRGVQIRMRGHDDDRQSGARDLDFLEQVQAAAAGHADIGHEHIGRIAAQRRQDIVGLVEALGRHAAALQRLLQHPANGGVVVDQPDLQRLHIHTESIGKEMTNIVLPGALSNSINPP